MQCTINMVNAYLNIFNHILLSYRVQHRTYKDKHCRFIMITVILSRVTLLTEYLTACEGRAPAVCGAHYYIGFR